MLQGHRSERELMGAWICATAVGSTPPTRSGAGAVEQAVGGGARSLRVGDRRHQRHDRMHPVTDLLAQEDSDGIGRFHGQLC